MAMEIFKLVGSIFVDSDQAEKSIGKTDKKAQGIGQTLSNGIKTAGKWGAAIVGGAAAAVTGITAFATKTASATDEIDKMSQRLGISRQAYQELDFALSQSGVDINSFQTGMKSLLKNMDAVSEGNKTAIANFEQLGVSAIDTSGKMRSQEEVLWDAISAFQGMEDGAEKSRLAQELFGKQGQEILPLLNAQSGGIEEMRKQAQELGLILGDDVVDSGVKLTDTIDQLKRSGGAIFTRLGGVIMPLVQKVADYIIGAMPKIESVFNTLAPVISQLFEGLVPPLMDLAQQIFPLLISLINSILPPVIQIVQAILPVIVKLLNTLLPPIIEIVQTLLPPLLNLLIPILDLLGPIIELLEPILNLVTSILEPIAELITGLLTPLIKIISKLIEVALKPLKSWWEILSNVLSSTVKGAIDLVMNKVEAIKGVFSGLIQFVKGVFTGDWKSAWDGVKKIFSSIWEGIKGAFKIPINWIIDGINAFINGINKIKVPDWVPLIGGKGFSIKPLNKLEQGGVLEKGQTGFLEGNGAEAVVPLENNRKWIRNVANDMDEAIGGGNKTVVILTAILQLLEELLGAGIYLDGERLVGYLAGPLDKKLGQIAAQKARA